MSSDREMVLMTVEYVGEPTLDGIAAKFGISPAEIDGRFGIIPVDPARNLFAVRIPADRVPPSGGAGERYQGPFSDPKIAPAGPLNRPKR